MSSPKTARSIAGLMGVAVVFSLVGNEIKAAGQKGSSTGGEITVAGKIILGGFLATGLLVLVSEAGDPGRQLGIGLATVTVLTSLLVYGGPVWDKLNALFGGHTTGATGSTATTVARAASPTASNPYLFPTGTTT